MLTGSGPSFPSNPLKPSKFREFGKLMPRLTALMRLQRQLWQHQSRFWWRRETKIRGHDGGREGTAGDPTVIGRIRISRNLRDGDVSNPKEKAAVFSFTLGQAVSAASNRLEVPRLISLADVKHQEEASFLLVCVLPEQPSPRVRS